MPKPHQTFPIDGGPRPVADPIVGLGLAGGVSINGDGARGEIVVIVGKDPEPAGSILLKFPTRPPEMHVAGDGEFGLIETRLTKFALLIAWTEASYHEGQRLRIAYELKGDEE